MCPSLLSQLNRGSDGRPFSRPILSDLRKRRHRAGCGYGDAALSPCAGRHQDGTGKQYPSEHLGVVIVAKHRNGETGDVYFA